MFNVTYCLSKLQTSGPSRPLMKLNGKRDPEILQYSHMKTHVRD